MKRREDEKTRTKTLSSYRINFSERKGAENRRRKP
jgi:hypothetical protein